MGAQSILTGKERVWLVNQPISLSMSLKQTKQIVMIIQWSILRLVGQECASPLKDFPSPQTARTWFVLLVETEGLPLLPSEPMGNLLREINIAFSPFFPER